MGPTQEVVIAWDTKPLVATYLEAETGSTRAPVAMYRAWAGPDNVPVEENRRVLAQFCFPEAMAARQPSRKYAVGRLTCLDTAKDAPKNG